MGATACGKTALSVRLAQSINAEIISVDSALVYRMMNIGTAKPDMRERAGIAHHLIDVCDPWEPYSAAQFCEDSQTLIKQIQQRGKRVLMVGGTMLYYKALEEGLAPLPKADESIRQSIAAEAKEFGWQAIHRELESVDPIAAQKIHPNDPQRLQRALEVYRLTGTPLTTLQAQTQTYLHTPAIKFALIPTNRQWLHNRIEQRFTQMVDDGFLQEVQQLYDNPKLHSALPSIRSIGYRQAWEYLASIDASSPDPESDPPTWVEKSIIATRQLAKRQFTWMRGMRDIHILECDTLSLEEQLQSISSIIN